MSIIHSALKKVETELRSPQSHAHVSPVKIKKGQGGIRLRKRMKPAEYLLLPLVLAGILFALWSISGIYTHPRAEVLASGGYKPGIDYEYIPILKKSYRLNGIFFSNETGYAIVNNQIVKTGDIFEGVEVRKIFPEEILLEKDGTPFLLNTRHK